MRSHFHVVQRSHGVGIIVNHERAVAKVQYEIAVRQEAVIVQFPGGESAEIPVATSAESIDGEVSVLEGDLPRTGSVSGLSLCLEDGRRLPLFRIIRLSSHERRYAIRQCGKPA